MSSLNEPIWIRDVDGDVLLICGVKTKKCGNHYGYNLEAILVNGGEVCIGYDSSDYEEALDPLRDKIAEFIANPKRKPGEILDLREVTD